MAPTLTYTAAVVAGLAIIASWLMIGGEKRLLSSLAAAVVLCIIAAVIIHVIA
jgi:hypothetical protein